MKSHHLVIFLVKLTFSGLLIWLVLHNIDFRSVVQRLRQVHPAYVAACLPVSLTVIALSAWRWHRLTRGLVGLGSAFRYTWIGLFYGAVLPGGIAGDVAKGAALALKDRSKRVALLPGSILMDRITGLVALVVLFFGCMLWCASSTTVAGDLRHAAWLGVGGSGVMLGLSGALLLPSVQRALRRGAGLWPSPLGRASLLRLGDTLVDYSLDLGLLGWAIGVSLIAHALNVVIFQLFFLALDVRMGIFDATVMYSGLSILVMIPISISAIGVRDWFALLYFQHLHLPPDAGVAFSWLSLIFGLVVAFGGGLVQIYELFLKSPSRPTIP